MSQHISFEVQLGGLHWELCWLRCEVRHNDGQYAFTFFSRAHSKISPNHTFRANPGCSSVHVQTLPVLGSWSWRAFFDVRCVLCHVIEILSIGFEMMWILNWWHSSCCLLFIFTPLCTRLLQVLYSRVLYRYFLHQSIHQRHWRLKANTFRIACTWMSSFGIC